MIEFRSLNPGSYCLSQSGTDVPYLKQPAGCQANGAGENLNADCDTLKSDPGNNKLLKISAGK